MIAIAIGWCVVVGAVVVAVTRPWREPELRSLYALGPAFFLAAWVIATGVLALSDAMAKGAWTGATLIIPFIGLKAIALSLIGYYAGLMFLRVYQKPSSRSVRAWGGPVLLCGIAIYVVNSDVRAVVELRAEQSASRVDLTEGEIAEINARIRAGAGYKSERLAFIANPKCPAELLADAVASSDPSQRLAATRNPALPIDDLILLSRDEDYQVRLYTIYSNRLPINSYQALLADPNEYVREALAWKENLSDEQFIQLLMDTSDRVRRTAESRWSYRTGPSESEVQAAFAARNGDTPKSDDGAPSP